MSFSLTLDGLLQTILCQPALLDQWKQTKAPGGSENKQRVIDAAMAHIASVRTKNPQLSQSFPTLDSPDISDSITAVLDRGLEQVAPQIPDALRHPPSFKQWNAQWVLAHMYEAEYERLKSNAPITANNLGPVNYAKKVADTWNRAIATGKAIGTNITPSTKLDHSRVHKGVDAAKQGIEHIHQRYQIQQATVLFWEEITPDGMHHPKVLFLTTKDFQLKCPELPSLRDTMLTGVKDILREYYGSAPDILRSQTVSNVTTTSLPVLPPRKGDESVAKLSTNLQKFVTEVAAYQTGHPYHKKSSMPWTKIGQQRGTVLTADSVPEHVTVAHMTYMKKQPIIDWYDHILARQSTGKLSVEFVLDPNAALPPVVIEEVDEDEDEEPLDYYDPPQASSGSALQSQTETIDHALKGAISFDDDVIDPQLSSSTTPVTAAPVTSGSPTGKGTVSPTPVDVDSHSPNNTANSTPEHTSLQQLPLASVVPEPTQVSVTRPPEIPVYVDASPVSHAAVVTPVPTSPPVDQTVNGKRANKRGRPRVHALGTDINQRGKKRSATSTQGGTQEATTSTTRHKRVRQLSHPTVSDNFNAPNTLTQQGPIPKGSAMITLGFEYLDTPTFLVSLDSYGAADIHSSLLPKLKTPWKKMAQSIAWAYHTVLPLGRLPIFCPSVDLESDVPVLIHQWAQRFHEYVSEKADSLFPVDAALLRDLTLVLPVVEFVKVQSRLFSEKDTDSTTSTVSWLQLHGRMPHLLWAMSIWGRYLSTQSPLPAPPQELLLCINGVTELGKKLSNAIGDVLITEQANLRTYVPISHWSHLLEGPTPMRDSSYTRRYGLVAEHFGGTKADMTQALNILMVETIMSLVHNNKLPATPRSTNTVLMELAHLPDHDPQNFGRLYCILREPQENAAGIYFVSCRLWLADPPERNWQRKVLRDSMVQCLLTFRNSLFTDGRERTLPRWVLLAAGQDRPSNANYRFKLAENWNYLGSPWRHITPGPTASAEDKKRPQTQDGRFKRWSLGAAPRKQNSRWPSPDGSTRRGRSRSPPPSSATRVYRPELQTWSMRERLPRARSLTPSRGGRSDTISNLRDHPFFNDGPRSSPTLFDFPIQKTETKTNIIDSINISDVEEETTKVPVSLSLKEYEPFELVLDLRGDRFRLLDHATELSKWGLTPKSRLSAIVQKHCIDTGALKEDWAPITWTSFIPVCNGSIRLRQ
ncbi:hypothetical protein K435DRAFT_796650 [Dendrothele bispora CBS 962.96]|uniref:Uncharacterized protein n=1 Tax=Dendrothele bispora (strain CBS 962.96) TaxID=1314807 RepID=A0A4S8M607_DENBC|nr:hypothetical protein K435DRAFT_796650 [Dendrothele bispora CBS 962.96]